MKRWLNLSYKQPGMDGLSKTIRITWFIHGANTQQEFSASLKRN
jgi:hypothetical protein